MQEESHNRWFFSDIWQLEVTETEKEKTVEPRIEDPPKKKRKKKQKYVNNRMRR